MTNGILQKAVLETAYCKAGVYGKAGSGKTMTSALLAIGLAQMSGGGPVAFFDSETGSDFVIRLFEAAGIELLVAKSRTFADLMTFMAEAEAADCSVSLTDSITHVWNDLRESYEKKLNRTHGLEIWDWGKIKPEWQRFTDAYLTSKMHAIVCGRAGNIYEQEYNEDKGKKEVVVTGTKMKAETEMGHEPSLLFEMERVPRGPGEKGWTHALTVIKDRFDAINGLTIGFSRNNEGQFLINGEPAKTDNHVIEALMPHIELLGLGGEHRVLAPTQDTQEIFDSPQSGIRRKRQVAITLEKVKEALTLADLHGTDKATKKEVVTKLRKAFGTSAWSEIESMRLEEMQEGLRLLRVELSQEAEDPKADARELLRVALRCEAIGDDQAAEVEEAIDLGDEDELRTRADWLRQKIQVKKLGGEGAEAESEAELATV